MDDEEPRAEATLNVNFDGVAGTWCIAHLLLPEDVRAQALYSTAMNFLVTADGNLCSDFETKFPKVVALLRDGPPSTVIPFTPQVAGERLG